MDEHIVPEHPRLWAKGEIGRQRVCGPQTFASNFGLTWIYSVPGVITAAIGHARYPWESGTSHVLMGVSKQDELPRSAALCRRVRRVWIHRIWKRIYRVSSRAWEVVSRLGDEDMGLINNVPALRKTPSSMEHLFVECQHEMKVPRSPECCLAEELS